MSNQDYTEDTQRGRDTSGMGDAEERDYGTRDRYAQHGTLNQGYGEAEEMGEEEWAEPLEEGQEELEGRQRGAIGASASERFEREIRERAGGGGDTGEEFREMVGGMYGEEGEEEQRER